MKFYQLKITRKGTKPPVWRRCLVPADIDFGKMAEILEEILEYPNTALYEYEFFQRKIRIQNLKEHAETEQKRGYEYTEAVDKAVSEFLDIENWFTFRIRGEEELPEYRLDIEKKLEDPKVERETETEIITYPVILKETKYVKDLFWGDADQKNNSLKQKYGILDIIDVLERKIQEMEKDDSEESATNFSRNPRVKDYLNSYKKEDLVESAKELEIDHNGSTKAELAEKIASKVLDPQVMKEIFLQADEWELDAFENAIDRKCFPASHEDWKDLEWFSNKGYIVAYSDNHAEVPQEVISVYKQINTPELQKKCRQFSWMRCCQSMLGLIYAIAPTKILFRMYRRREGFRVNFEEFMEILKKVCETDDMCMLMGDKVVWKAVLQNDLYERIEEYQGDREFYIPGPNEILDYAKHGYPSEDASYKKLYHFLKDELLIDELKLEEMLYIVYKEFSMNGKLSDIMKEFEEYQVIFEDRKQIETFSALMMEVNNNTRMLDFRGHTPNEIVRSSAYTNTPSGMMPLPSMVPMAESQTSITNMQPKKKIYPNDPCPCGSGKKYKKCCGRN